MFYTARVIDTSMAFKPTRAVYAGNEIELPIGTIKLRNKQVPSVKQPIDFYAIPLDLSDYSVPLTGEIVLVTEAADANGGKRFYYSKPFNIHSTLNTNSAPNYFTFNQSEVSSNTYNLSPIKSRTAVGAPKYISHTEQPIAMLQPYDGDKIISSRYGSNIRFSSNINKGQSTYFVSNTPWKGSGTNSPIIMLTAGLAKSTNFYTIENPDVDKSYIYLASDQSIAMSPAQQKIGTARAPSTYSDGQIVIGSDRLFFNARLDDITLVSKSTVNIATSNWAADMDKFFTQVDQLQQQLTKLTAQVSALSTALVASSTADSVTGIIPGALILNPAANSVNTQVSSISAELGNISTILASLKQ
jgi:hypothetical protein